MLPSPLTLTLFPLNVPAWSLFFEVVANCGHGGHPLAAAAIGIAGNLPCLCLVLVPIVIANGSSNLGAVWTQWPVGLMRTALSFCAGMLVAQVPMRTDRG